MIRIIRKNWPFLLLYSVIFILASLAGFRMEIQYSAVQLMDPKLLESRFWETLLNLHCQPPALNFLLGVLLRLKELTGVSVEAWVLGMNFVLGLVITASVASLAKSMIKDRLVSVFVIVLFLVNPYLYRTIFSYFYTIHELCFLSLLGVLVYDYLKGPRLRTYACICVITALLVYTHSIFHYLWPMPLLAALPVLVKRGRALENMHFYKTYALAGLTLVLLLAWPVKNYVKFGYFGYSSWQGMSFTTKAVKVPLVEPRPEYVGIPVLMEQKKSDGSPNWNYYAVMPASKWMQSRFFEAVKRNPGLLLERAIFFYLEGYTIYEGRSTWTGRMYTNSPAMRRWTRAYEILTFQYIGEAELEGVVLAPHTSFVFLFPLIILFAALSVFRYWKAMPVEAATAAFMLYSVLWVLMLTLVVNGFEGNRYRFPNEPYIMILAGWASTLYKGSRTKKLIIYGTLSLCILYGLLNWALWA